MDPLSATTSNKKAGMASKVDATSSLQFKVINDPIHGHIELHPLVVKIIDTPQFQRLRCIAQLGTCYYVFPGATHKRFEHSIGTCHLAGELVKTLYNLQPELDVDPEKREKDILCVQIAGLCHDLGHGPFSHLFDGKFMRAFPNDKNERWKHEQGSLDMFDYMVQKNKLESEFAKYKLGQKDINFIKALIHRPSKHVNESETGRGKDKLFLFEVVANKRNGIDVDKWDYFARDAYNVGISNNFDHRRMMKFARVIEVDGEKQICWRKKECSNIYDMFHTRALLHRRVYQHKTHFAIESMITSAFLAANDHISLPTESGKTCKLSDAVHDMSAYMRVTDHLYYHILYSTDKKLSTAREIIERIERRDLYRFIGQVKLHKMAQKKRNLKGKSLLLLVRRMREYPQVQGPLAKLSKESCTEDMQEPDLRAAIEALTGESAEAVMELVGTQPYDTDDLRCCLHHAIVLSKEALAEQPEDAQADDFQEDEIISKIISAYDDLKDPSLLKIGEGHIKIQIVTLDYGMKDKNPIDNVRFYRKDYPDVPVKVEPDEVLHITPSRFRDCSVRVFSKKTDPESLKSVKKCFEAWCQKIGLNKGVA